MTDFWTEEDERRLAQLRQEYEALLTRRSGVRRSGPLDARSRIRASTIYDARRLRETCFLSADVLFGEPGWEILLDLHSAHERGQLVSLSSACLGARIAGTTGRRWLRLLEGLGMVECRTHAWDGRAQVVTLTADARAMMDSYLQRLSSCACAFPVIAMNLRDRA